MSEENHDLLVTAIVPDELASRLGLRYHRRSLRGACDTVCSNEDRARLKHN